MGIYDQAMATIFTRILNGEIPGRVLWDDDVCFAILDIRPLHPGHTIVIPKAEIDQWVDLDPATVAHLSDVAQRIGIAQRSIIDSNESA